MMLPVPSSNTPLSVHALQGTLTPPVPLYENTPYCLKLPPVSRLLLAVRLAELYTLAFPERPEWLADAIEWPEEEDAIAAVELFLERVHTLFPVHHDFTELDLEEAEWWLYEIPITPFGFDLWDDGVQNFKEPIPFLFTLMHTRSGNERWELDETFEARYPDFPLPPRLEPEQLIATLRQMPLSDPLTALPDLIEMLAQATGNLWLDTSVESLAEDVQTYQWTTANLTRLHHAWQEADPVLQRIFQLLDWQHTISGNGGRKLALIRDLLLQAYHLTQTENGP